MGDEIKYSDFAEEGGIQKFISDLKEADGFLKEFEKTWDSIKAKMKSNAKQTGKDITGIDTSTIEGVQKLDAELKKLQTTSKGLSDIQKELISAREKNKISIKSETDLIKAKAQVDATAAGSVNNLRAQLKLVTLQWNELTEIEKGNIEISGPLSKAKLDLTNRLKGLEAATGDHRREVGNYANGLKGLSAISVALGMSLGIHKETLHELKEIYTELRHAVHGVHQVKKELLGMHHKATEAIKAEKDAEEAAKAVKMASIPVIGLVIIALGALAAAIYFVSENTKEAKKEEEDRNRAADGTVIKNKEVRDSYNELLVTQLEVTQAWEVMSGAITENEAALESLELKNKIVLQNISNETKAKLKENEHWYNTVLNLMTGGAAGTINQARQDKDIYEGSKQQREIAEKKLESEKEAKRKESELKEFDAHEKFLKRMLDLDRESLESNGWLNINKSGKDSIENKVAILMRQKTIDLALIHGAGKEQTDARIEIERDYQVRIQKLRDDFNNKEAADSLKAYEAKKKNDEEIKKAQEVALAEKIKAEEAASKRLIEISKEEHDNLILILQTKVDRDKRLKKNSYLDQIHLARANYEAVQNDYDQNEKKLSEKEKEYEEHKAMKAGDAILKRDQEQLKIISDNTANMNGKLLKAQEEFEQKKTDIIDAQMKERLQHALRIEELILDGVSKGLDLRNQMEKEAGSYRIVLLDNEIQQQNALAAAGQESHASEVIRAKAEAIAEQKELDKKAFRQQKAEKLAMIFLEFQQQLIKTGSRDAAAQAIIKTIEAEAIAESLAYAFAEEGGILGDTLRTDYKLFSKKHKSGEEVLVQAQKGEAFVSLADMEGLKQGLIPSWMKKYYNPGQDHGINHSLSASIELNELRSEISEFTKVIRDRPLQVIHKDLLGNLVVTNSENGRYKSYIQQNSEIIPRDSWHA